MSKKDQSEQAPEKQELEQSSAPEKSNMDILREQAALNEQINYQPAKVKGQSIVRGK